MVYHEWAHIYVITYIHAAKRNPKCYLLGSTTFFPWKKLPTPSHSSAPLWAGSAKIGIKQMPYYSITSRPHPSEIQIFEDWLLLILPFIKEREYYYTVEKDDSCDRHLHVVLEDNAVDVTNFKKKLETKKFKNFKDSIKNNLTDFEQLTFCKKIKEGEETINIGYIFKETNSRQGSSEFGQTVIAEEFITQCIKEYFTDERIKARGNEPDDVTIITSKNFYSKVNDYCKKNNITHADHTLYLKMIRGRYGFINISTKQLTRGFRELKIMNKVEDHEDVLNTRSELFDNSVPNYQMSEFEEISQDLKHILELLKNKKDFELEQKLNNYLEKYYFLNLI